jgi:hypothetical protein
MTTDVPKPPHPMFALTTSELSKYRSQLEHALKDRQVGQAEIAVALKQRLDEVLAEQEQRNHIRNGSRKGPLGR